MTHARTFTAAFLALWITGYSGAQTVRCTTWNLQWFPNGSANETSTAQQDQRIKEAADVLRPVDPDIVLLEEVRDYKLFIRADNETLSVVALSNDQQLTRQS